MSNCCKTPVKRDPVAITPTLALMKEKDELAATGPDGPIRFRRFVLITNELDRRKLVASSARR